MMSTICKKRRV